MADDRALSAAALSPAAQSNKKIALTFPDGARREFPDAITGLDVAKGISPSLAKRTVAMALDGRLADLADPIEHDAKIEFINRDDPRALELIRHDAAHVMAEAVQSLWPGTQVTIGPVIENGFYYDFFRNEPFTTDDLAAIEKKMKEIIARDKPFTKEVWSREKAKQTLPRHGRALQGRTGRRDPCGPDHPHLQAGRLVRPLPRPAHDLDRQGRQCLQADEGRGRLLARRFQPRDALAHLRHRLAQAGGARRLPQADRGGREARPPQARPRDGPVPLPGGGAGLGVLASAWLDAVPGAGKLHPPAPAGIRLHRGELAAAHGQGAVGHDRPHADLRRHDVSHRSSARRTSASMRSSR